MPGGVFLCVTSFSFAVLPSETVFRLNFAVTCTGNPAAARLTFPLKPFFGVMAVAPPPALGPGASPPPRRTTGLYHVAIRYPDRRSLADALRRAYVGAEPATDCAALVEGAGGRVKVVEGDPHLLKVTTTDDLAKIESWLQAGQSRPEGLL